MFYAVKRASAAPEVFRNCVGLFNAIVTVEDSIDTYDIDNLTAYATLKIFESINFFRTNNLYAVKDGN